MLFVLEFVFGLQFCRCCCLFVCLFLVGVVFCFVLFLCVGCVRNCDDLSSLKYVVNVQNIQNNNIQKYIYFIYILL